MLLSLCDFCFTDIALDVRISIYALKVEDLAVASPATVGALFSINLGLLRGEIGRFRGVFEEVSRCGMVFLEQMDIGWQVLMLSWRLAYATPAFQGECREKSVSKAV